jgi:predicted peroxiredoxin/TusA-related sulfurtransferase
VAKIEAQASIDMRGKKITTFILHDAVMKLRDMATGEVVELVTDDFEPIESDVRAWCRMTGHKLVELKRDGGCQRYIIEKGEPKETEHKLALVMSNPGLEELLSPLAFALAAALASTEVYIYFQGPAVRVLAKGFRARLSGLSRPFSVFARRGMAKTGHIPPQDKLKQLKELGARFYACGPSMDHFGVKKSEFIFDDVTVSEYLTFMEVMKGADIHIYPS